MNEIIRKSVFETNSSSTHSICIAGGDFVPDKLIIPPDGILRVFCGEYGWEPEDYYGIESKLSYIATDLMASVYSCGYNGKQEEYNWEHPNFVEVWGKVTRILKGTYKDIREIRIERGEGFYPYGYIDHQSQGVLYEAYQSSENLRNFLLNPDSSFSTDNDNRW